MGRAALFTRRGYSAPRHVPASRRSAGLTNTSRRAYVGSSGATVALPLRPSAERLVLRLRRAADVAVVEPADLGQGNNAAVLGWLDGVRLGCILLKREVRPRAVVVA